jgi:hypothetical protein
MTATPASGPSGTPPVPRFPGLVAIVDGPEALPGVAAPDATTDAASQPEGANR